MQRLSSVFGLLAFVAISDWLLGRTLLRTAIHMPKSEPIILFYRGMALISQFVLTASSLLALAALGWIAWRSREKFKGLFSLSLAVLMVLSLVFLVVPPTGAAGLASHFLTLAVIGMIALDVARRSAERSRIIAWVLPAAALSVVQGATIFSTTRAFPLLIFGEIMVVASGFALWWAYGRQERRIWMWLAAGLPVIVFSSAYLLQPALTGIMIIWSTGLTLFLPWPLYAASLWLAGVAAISSLRRGEPAGWAILLLIAGGFAPQLSTHSFLGLVALWLLSPNAASVADDASQSVSGQPARMAREAI